MRILNISAQKPDSTGSGVYLTRTVAEELAAGHEAFVLCGINAGDATDAVDPRAGLMTVEFNTDALPFNVCGMSDAMPYPATRYRDLTPEMAAAFEREFKRAVTEAVETFKPDVIVCHHLYLLMAIVVETVKDHWPDVRVAAVSHATDLRQFKNHGLARDRILAAVKRLDAVCALHASLADDIAETLGVERDRIWIVGTGYDRETFTAGEAGMKEPGSLLYVGKMCRAKGVESLFRALGDYPACPDVSKLRLVGGWGADRVERMRLERARQGVRFPTHFMGRVTMDELVLWYRKSEVFVLPSFYEGLPLVIVEALACGCKVVATELPGVRPWIEAELPGAPVWWVKTPRMRGIDQPCSADLPAFEAELARAIEEAVTTPAEPADMSRVSWEAVTARILESIA